MTSFLELRNITKYFSHVVANQDVSFSVNKEEVLALLGENGAGKSTVMKILYGLNKADSGEIFINGEHKNINSPKDAMNLGITMIQQHFSLVPAHTVTENIVLGSVTGKINWEESNRKIADLAAFHGFEIDPKAYVKDLAVGVQQKVEILKALYHDTRLLIMDEPTAVLTPQESDQLMEFVAHFKEMGNSVIFITHKLQEVMSVADRIVVMRNGRVNGDFKKEDTNEQELSRLMIGRNLETDSHLSSQKSRSDSKIRLKLENISLIFKGEIPRLNGVSLEIREGEIFGIAGVSGNGQQELCEIICGIQKPTTGKIYLNESDFTDMNIRERIHNGIGYVPSDRQKDGLVMDMTLSENLLLKSSYDPDWVTNGMINQKKLNRFSEKAISDFEIKAPGPFTRLRDLSGGNQQKVVLAREAVIGEKLMVFDQPTRGLDLGAIDNVHKAILSEKSKGNAVLLISTELSEILELSDRYSVIYKGALQGTYHRGELSVEEIGLLMAGYRNLEKAENEQ